jgi:hypothetical protein
MSDKKSCELGVALCRSCDLEGKSYNHGSEIASGARILECSDGGWSEYINPFVTAGP